ncbi:MAG: phospholipase D-like domain-containing protein, partial [Pseudobdellovibrionaceae bacterium]
SKIGSESSHGKYYHSLWVKGLENACAVSAKSKQRTRVVLHSAYVFFSSNLVNAIGSMINGRWNCKNVDIVILTNAIETTDLFAINIFARYQLNGILSYNFMIEKQKNSFVTANQNKATIKYYEYNVQNAASGHSLHTKVSVLGDDVIVGSANADVRSYFMDTNNGVYIRNAKSMVRDYNQYIDSLIAKGEVVDKTASFNYVDTSAFQKENDRIAEYAIKKWPSAAKALAGDRKAKLLAKVQKWGMGIRQTTENIIKAHEGIRENGHLGESDSNGAPGLRAEDLDEMANQFDKMWKPI